MNPGGQAIAHFVAKWHAREPEMALAEPFCPPAERERFRAWGALVHELREALFELSDPRVAAVKGRWWAEELLGLAAGRSRHPLTAPLADARLPWAALAAGMASQLGESPPPDDVAASLAQLAPLCDALARVEAGLAGVEAPASAADAIGVHLRLHRLPAGLAAPDRAGVPRDLLARHGEGGDPVAPGQDHALLRDWARHLLQVQPDPRGLPLFRRLRTGFDRVRLARLAAGRGVAAPAAPATVWRAWRLARMR